MKRCSCGQAIFDYVIMFAAVVVVLIVFLNPNGAARRAIERTLNNSVNQFNAMASNITFN